MLDVITLGDISIAVAFLVALFTGVAFLNTQLKKRVKDMLSEEFMALDQQLQGIESEVKDVKEELKEVDMESCKNYLVTFLSNLSQGSLIDEIEMERFWEQYKHYTKQGGNGYIHRKVEKCKEKNLL